MAAGDELPRGWTLSTDPGFGATATLTLPAIANVAHVLDAFDAKAIAQAAFPGGYVAVIGVSDSAGLAINVGILGLEPSGAGNDEAGGQSLGIVCGVGASLTVTLDSSPDIAVFLLVQGHDI